MEYDLYEAWFDGSFNNDWGNGIGYSIRKNGIVIEEDFVLCEKICRKSSEVEVQALLTLTTRLVDLGIKNVIIYGDERNVIHRVKKRYQRYFGNNQSIAKHEYKSFYFTIINQLNEIGNWDLIWIPREENTVAHELSRGNVKLPL